MKTFISYVCNFFADSTEPLTNSQTEPSIELSTETTTQPTLG